MPIPIEHLSKHHPDDPLIQKLAEYQGKPLTWGLLDLFIRAMGFDQDEYFHKFMTAPVKLEDEIFTVGVRWVPVYWVEGGSEGYYVHVDRIIGDNNTRELMFLGKFWDWQRAEEVTTAVARFINLLYW